MVAHKDTTELSGEEGFRASCHLQLSIIKHGHFKEPKVVSCHRAKLPN